MTTTVIVKAHCAKEKEVVVTLQNGNDADEAVIQDGQEWSGVVYDAKSVTVFERMKEQ